MGTPKKVDWAGLFWFMVEKELLKREQLVDCYYASHLQYLIKSQREEVMLRQHEEVVLKLDQDGGDLDADELVLKEEQDRVDLDAEEFFREEKSKVELDAERVVLREERDGVELDAEVKEEKGSDVKRGDLSEVQVNDVLAGPNVELTLGQEVEENEEVKDAEMMDVEKDEEQELKQRQEDETPVLVEFWAPWCGPCRMIHPIIDELAKEYARKLKCSKVSTDDSPGIATRYGIRSMFFYQLCDA